MKSLLVKQQCQWLFTFIWLILGLEFLRSPSLFLAICLSALFIRMIFLRSSTLFWTLLCSLLIMGHFQWQSYRLEQTRLLSVSLEENQSYQLQFLPADCRLTANYFSGPASLKLVDASGEAIDVQVNYWFEEEGDVPVAIQDVATTWLVKGTLSPPEKARNFGVFDYQDYLLNQGIVWTLTLSEVSQIQTTPAKQLSIWQANLRARLTKPLRKFATYPWVGLHNKLLFNMHSETYDVYRDDLLAMGIIHYFAISGFHLDFIRRMLRYFLLRIGLLLEIAEGLLLIILIMYAWLVQWPAGVIRSLGTFYGRKLCQRFDWPFSLLDQLALVGILMLIVNPLISQSVGFRLSFLMSALIQFYRANATGHPYSFRYSSEMTLACLLFSWPLIIYMNAEWSVFQIVVVIVFGLVFDRVFMPMMCLTTLLLYVLGSWDGLGRLLELLSVAFEWLWQTSAPIEWLRWTKIVVGSPDAFTIFVLFFVASGWLFWLKTRKLRAYGLVIGGYLLVMGILPYGQARNSLIILDVGQGDAVLYQPAFSQEAWLIDTGGRMLFSEQGVQLDPTSASHDLLPALKALGVRHLTGVVITHPDIDHMGNLLGLAQALAIEHLIISPYTAQSSLWQTLAPSLDAKTQVSLLELGQSVHVSGTTLSVIALAETPDYYQAEASNDSSLVTVLQLGELKVLNLGDLSIAGERRLINDYPDLRANVIKIGHHGSDTSSSDALLTQVGAQLALISAGEINRYGHPHAEVIERLEEFELAILETNKVGAIRLTYHPWWGYRVETALEPD